MVTGAGKSLVLYILGRFFLAKGLKGVLIVPNVGLVEQMKSDYITYSAESSFDFEKDCHVIYAGKPKHFEKKFTITTWQSMAKSKELFKDVDFILVDEAHLANGSSIRDLVNASINSKYKIGVTGTVPDNLELRFYLTSAFGQIKKLVTSQQLIQAGYLTPVNILLWYIKHPYMKKMTWAEESAYFEECQPRNEFLVKLALSLTKKRGNTLLLFNKIKHGKLLVQEALKQKLNPTQKIKEQSKEVIFSLTPSKDKREWPNALIYTTDDKAKGTFNKISSLKIFYISGAVKGSERDYVRKILENEKEALLIANYATTSTGINIKNLHNIIFGISRKSEISILQSIGRSMRLHDDKEDALIVDIEDEITPKRKKAKPSNYCAKHLESRLSYYMENEYPLIEKETNLDCRSIFN